VRRYRNPGVAFVTRSNLKPPKGTRNRQRQSLQSLTAFAKESIVTKRVPLAEPFDPQRVGTTYELTPTAESTAPGGWRFPHFTPVYASRLRSPREHVPAPGRVPAARAGADLLPHSSQSLRRPHPTG
jgi:hypothetical protein